MLVGYRLKHIALGGLALALLGCAPLATQKFDVPETLQSALDRCGYEEAHTAAESARQKRDSPERSATRAVRREQREAAEAAERNEGHAKDCEDRARELADLGAQWHAAKAAENTGIIAARELDWSRLNFFALLLTIAVAMGAIVESRLRSHREQRAYVFPLASNFETRMERDSMWLVGGIRLANTGQTPAFLTEVCFDHAGEELPDNGPVHPDADRVTAQTILAANNHEGTPIYNLRILNPTGDYHVFGYVKYRTIFNRRRERITRFAWKIDGITDRAEPAGGDRWNNWD